MSSQPLIITVGWNRLHWKEAGVLRGGFWDCSMQGLSKGQSNYSCSHQMEEDGWDDQLKLLPELRAYDYTFPASREWLGSTLCTTQICTCSNSHWSHGTLSGNIIKASSCHLGVWWMSMYGASIYFFIISESFWLLQIWRIWSHLRPCGKDFSSSDPEEVGEPTYIFLSWEGSSFLRHSGLNISVPLDQDFVPL